MRASVIGLIFLLGACSTQQRALVDLGVAKVRAANDTAAAALIAAACGMSFGAYNRLENPNEQRGVDLLCGGSGTNPITAEGLAAFLAAQQFLSSQ